MARSQAELAATSELAAGLLGGNAYITAKAAVEVHTRNLAAELTYESGVLIFPEASAAGLLEHLPADDNGVTWPAPAIG
ncbi:hypothetical protein [Amycolatopsis sp. NPDC051372]|uniref:hypothetical protein n=1 Tax=unclassified Amycolatopsis TaxID=2618356 RepID=UPI00343CF072